MADNSIIAIQDMGAAGLTSSSVEMASKGKLGIELDLSKVPCREEKMTPYEIMLSESQERMLIVLEKGKEDHAKKIFDKWNLDFAVIGKTTDSKKIELIFDQILILFFLNLLFFQLQQNLNSIYQIFSLHDLLFLFLKLLTYALGSLRA